MQKQQIKAILNKIVRKKRLRVRKLKAEEEMTQELLDYEHQVNIELSNIIKGTDYRNGIKSNYGDSYLKDIKNVLKYLKTNGFKENKKNESMWYKKIGKDFIEIDITIDKPDSGANMKFYERAIFITIDITSYLRGRGFNR